MNRVCTLQDLQAHESSAQRGARENAHLSGPGRTLAGTPEQTSTLEVALGAAANPSGPSRTLAGTPESTSTLEAALGETPHPGQQNGSERLANLPSESHLLGSVKFGDNNTNCGNTTDSYNNTTNNNTTNNNNSAITNNAEKIYGGGTNNTISGTFS